MQVYIRLHGTAFITETNLMLHNIFPEKEVTSLAQNVYRPMRGLGLVYLQCQTASVGHSSQSSDSTKHALFRRTMVRDGQGKTFLWFYSDRNALNLALNNEQNLIWQHPRMSEAFKPPYMHQCQSKVGIWSTPSLKIASIYLMKLEQSHIMGMCQLKNALFFL